MVNNVGHSPESLKLTIFEGQFSLNAACSPTIPLAGSLHYRVREGQRLRRCGPAAPSVSSGTASSSVGRKRRDCVVSCGHKRRDCVLAADVSGGTASSSADVSGGTAETGASLGRLAARDLGLYPCPAAVDFAGREASRFRSLEDFGNSEIRNLGSQPCPLEVQPSARTVVLVGGRLYLCGKIIFYANI